MASNRDDDKHRETKNRTLFRQSIGDTRKLTARKRHVAKPPPPAGAGSTRQDEISVVRESLGRPPVEENIAFGDNLVFQRPNVPRSVMRQLRRGKFPAKEEIDLHGLTVPEARETLRDFIAQSSRSGIKCIRVVHGKGLGSGSRGPILKSKVNRWLRQWDEVLAFCSTPARDGGTGAVYVLLQQGKG